MTTTLTRKQREIRQREALIRQVARRMLLERGYLGLTMDRIASATEYSKGTIYQHFPNKEEILAALAVETASKRSALFERAATFRGRPRERMVAIGEASELFFRLHPDHFQSELIIRTASIRDKTSPERQARLAGCAQRCMGAAIGIVRDAIAQGDLMLSPERLPEELTYGLWTMAMGSQLVMSIDTRDVPIQLADPYAVLRNNYQRFLDGYGWEPLSYAWDYEETRARIRREIFGAEYERLERDA